MTGEIVPVTEKPRLLKHHAVWVCTSYLKGKGWYSHAGVIMATGPTPAHAYAAWLYEKTLALP